MNNVKAFLMVFAVVFLFGNWSWAAAPKNGLVAEYLFEGNAKDTSPSSAVINLKTSKFRMLRWKWGIFLHYIFHDSWPIGKQDLHPLKQHLEGLWGTCHYPQPDGFIPCR